MFYGSQTGTAEEFANRLSKDAHRYGMRGMAADPEEYDPVSRPRSPILLLAPPVALMRASGPRGWTGTGISCCLSGQPAGPGRACVSSWHRAPSAFPALCALGFPMLGPGWCGERGQDSSTGWGGRGL